MASFLDKVFNHIQLVLLNIAIIAGAEFAGAGKFFEETGLIHGIVLVFVFLIMARIFSEYAFGDYILKGFLKIQLGFFVLLGLIHIYEYLGLYVLKINNVVVESTATLLYVIWLIGNVIALEFVFRIYQKKKITQMAFLIALASLVGLVVVLMHVFSGMVQEVPRWIKDLMVILAIVFGALGIWCTSKITTIMPIFKSYAYYRLPATFLVVAATLSEYAESTGILKQFGISETQNLYLSHFTIYAALSFLLIAYGKLKRPEGIYSEM